LPAVARSNIDVAQANSQAFSRRDADAMLELYAPDAVVVDRRAIGWGEFRGRDALRSYYQGLFDNVEEIHEDLEVVDDRGDLIIARCHLTATLVGRPEGGDMNFDYALRIAFADGLIESMDIYEDAAAASAA
jgi:ketosteroid isomerase-like protein